MARFEIATPGGPRVFEIDDEFVTIGNAAGNHLRLDDPAVAPVHVRLIRRQGGYRLEGTSPETQVEVNGEACAARVLQPNDRIRIGDTTLTFVDDVAAPPAPAVEHGPRASAPASPRRHAPEQPRAAARAGHHHAQQHHGQHHGQPHGQHHGQRHAQHHGHHGQHHGHHHGHHGHEHPGKGKISWPVWAGLAALGFGIVLVLMRVGGAGSYYDEEGSPEHWLTRAETELKQGAFQRALDSVQMAELRKPDADTKSRIESMREKIKSTMGRERDEVAITAARRGLGVMEEFEQLHLSASRPRPAVRELARNAQQWLQNYGDVMRRYPETSADVAKVKSMYDRFAPEAQLDRPDDSGDVLFKVERRLSLPVPLYSDALAAIDDYLRTHATDPKAQDLRDRRTQVVDKAKADFDRHETAARRFLSIRQFADARKEVMAMRNAIVVNAWAKVADALEKDIDSAAK